MGITSIKNQYWGINAHFQGYAQNERNAWSPFHHQYISDLARSIGKSLRGSGYTVAPVDSIQVRLEDKETGRLTTQNPIPDITLRKTPAYQPGGVSSSGDNLAIPMAVGEIDEEYLTPLQTSRTLKAVVIQKDEDEIARIEILSPTNKKMGEDRTEYLEKRAHTLRNGVILIEVDYLPQTPTLSHGIPDYGSQEPDSRPYTLSVIDPRPAPNGRKMIFGFAVDEPMAAVQIPLLNADTLNVDFGGVYNETFNSLDYFSNKADYSRNPAGFEYYTPADQQKIWGRMLALADALRGGIPLDDLTEPVAANPADPGLMLINSLPYKRASLFIDPASLEACWLVQHISADKKISLVLVLRQVQGQSVSIQQRDLLMEHARAVEAAHQELEKVFDRAGFSALLQQADHLA